MNDFAPPQPVAREPFVPPPIKAVFHINKDQGIGVPDSLIPKGEDGKPVSQAPDPIEERRLETYRKFGVGEDVIAQIAERRPVSEMEHRLCQHKLDALKADPAFVKRYLEGGIEERRVMMTLSAILGSPIKADEKS